LLDDVLEVECWGQKFPTSTPKNCWILAES